MSSIAVWQVVNLFRSQCCENAVYCRAPLKPFEMTGLRKIAPRIVSFHNSFGIQSACHPTTSADP